MRYSKALVYIRIKGSWILNIKVFTRAKDDKIWSIWTTCRKPRFNLSPMFLRSIRRNP